jgi:hypothetical protein
MANLATQDAPFGLNQVTFNPPWLVGPATPENAI